MKNNHLLLMNHPLLYWGFIVILMVIVNYYLGQWMSIQPLTEPTGIQETMDLTGVVQHAESSIEGLPRSSENGVLTVQNIPVDTQSNSSKSFHQLKRTLLK